MRSFIPVIHCRQSIARATRSGFANLLRVLAILFIAESVQAASYIAVSTANGIDQYIVNGSAWTFDHQIIARANLYGVTYNPADGMLYACDATAASPQIIKVNSSTGDQTTLATRGVATPGWTVSLPQNISFGADGKLYFSTAFGTAPNTSEGVFSMNLDGSGFAQFIPRTGIGWALDSSRDLSWVGTNLFVTSRGNNNVYKFDNTGALGGVGAINSAAVTGASSVYADTNSGALYVGSNQSGVNSIRTLNISGALPVAPVSATDSGGKVNSLSILRIEGVLFYLTFNQGTGSRGSICRLNADKTTTVVLADLGATANDFTFMGAASTGTFQSVDLQLKRSQMVTDTFQQAAVVANYLLITNDVTLDPATAYTSSNTNIVMVSASGRLAAVAPGVADVVASFNGKSDTNTVTVVALAASSLIHRYNFDTGANDLVGTQNGTIIGSTASIVDGQVSLVAASQFDFNYVDFGADAISSHDEITFEAWATFGTNYNWARLFDFGNNDGINGLSYVALVPHSSSGTTRLTIKTDGTEQFAEAAGTLDNKTNVYIAAVYHPLAGYIKLYLNGVLVAQNTNVTRDLAGVTNATSYLGLSQFFVDPAVNMLVDEFRIWRGVLFPTNIAFNAAAGASNPVSNPGTLIDITLAGVPPQLPQLSKAQASLRANFANVGNVSINDFPGVAFSSSDTNTVGVGANGLITAVAPGTAIITATYGPQSSQVSVTVTEVIPEEVLVTDLGNNRVAKFYAYGTNWVAAPDFAAGSIGGSPLTAPVALALGNGVVYIAESPAIGGRILKYSATGTYLGTAATGGVDYFARPDMMTADTNGNVYFSTPFGFTGGPDLDLIYKLDASTGVISTNVIKTDNATYSLDNPRGIAFGADGVLCVASRSGFSSGGRPVQKFDPATGQYLGDLIGGLTAPNALAFDKVSGKFLASVNSAADLIEVDENGNSITFLDDASSHTILGIARVGSHLFFSDFGGNGADATEGVYVVSGNNSAAKVAAGLVDPGTILVLPPRIQINVAGNNATLKWPGAGSLQAAPTVTGVYTNVPGATSPYTNVITGEARFFRLTQ